MNFLLKTSLSALLFLGSCTDNPKTGNENPNEKTHAVKPVEIKTWTSIYDANNLKIKANSDIDESMIQSVKVKFEPYVWFEDFPAKTIDTISKAPLDFSTNRKAKEYMAVIKNCYKKGKYLFGGHYQLINWDSGSSRDGVIVDLKTGQIIRLPESLAGYECHYNSYMLIINPTDETGFYDLKQEHGIYAPFICVFDEVKKEFKLLKTKGE